jgi:hypothetical protein
MKPWINSIQLSNFSRQMIVFIIKPNRKKLSYRDILENDDGSVKHGQNSHVETRRLVPVLRLEEDQERQDVPDQSEAQDEWRSRM